jgi:hypothetical protein
LNQTDDASEPTFRWEYVSRIDDPVAIWCRHHIQGPLLASLGTQVESLNDLHTPTGPLPIEELLRFCIVDLGVRPLSAEWDARLRERMEQDSALQIRRSSGPMC